MRHLNETQRKILRTTLSGGWSAVRIADEMNLAVGTVQYQMRRVRLMTRMATNQDAAQCVLRSPEMLAEVFET